MKHTQIYWLHTLSPTHVGTGRGVGYIDLPIHRDKVTGWPLVPGSAFKGVWADSFGATDRKRSEDPHLSAAFGRASDQHAQASNAGALVPTDARLVCLPIRSFHGTFAWCTSAMALQLLQRDLALAGVTGLPPLPPSPATNEIRHTKTTALQDNGRILLEDLDFTGKPCDSATAWAGKLAEWIFPGEDDAAWRPLFIQRFAVLPDTIFDFFSETGTEVTTRVCINDETKAVATGQLWNEEALPAETILAGLVCCERIYAHDAVGITPDDLIRFFATQPLSLQIGGKATVGRGRVRCIFTAAAADKR